MFIRIVSKRDKQTGKAYNSYKLVENYRSERGPRQRVLLNLGSNFSLSEGEWTLLANRIEEICTGQGNFISCSDKIEALAKHYATLLTRKSAKKVTTDENNVQIEESTYTPVDLTSLYTADVRHIGLEHILTQTAHELGIKHVLEELGLNSVETDIAIATIVARAACPASERRTHYYLSHVSAVDELLGTSFRELSLHRLYEISDKLLRHKDALEMHLEHIENEIIPGREAIILYDITNTYFEGFAEANAKAKYGRSKEKRSDCPLVSFGLAVDSLGFVKRSLNLPGNVVETETLSDMIDRLSDRTQPLIRPIIVMDAGIASNKNLAWLKERGYSYITIFRRRRREIPPGEGEPVLVKDNNDNEVTALSVRDEASGEIHLYCHSSARNRRENRLKSKTQEHLETELLKLKNGLNKPYCTKSYEKVLERVTRLRERYKRISRFYNINLVRSDDSKKVIDITWNIAETDLSREFNGSYCLRTDLNTFSEQQLWNIYMMLDEVERGFREMKSELGLRPVFHQKDKRVDGHMWITLLAYHLTHLIRYKLREKGIRLSWSSIRDIFSTQIRVTSSVKKEDGTVAHIRTTSDPSAEQEQVLKALKLPLRPLGQTIATF